MTDKENRIKATEYEPACELDRVPAPDGFDPEAHGWKDLPVGRHRCYIDGPGSRIERMKPQKDTPRGGSQQTYYLDQFQPRLVCAAGEHAGASIFDFIPMPTVQADSKGGLLACEMSTRQANQWANLIRAFGFQAPPGKMAPPGFKLEKLYGTAASGPFADVEIVLKVNQDGTPAAKDDGTPQYKVKMFGYEPPIERKLSPQTQKAAASQPLLPGVYPEQPQQTAASGKPVASPAFDL